MAGLSDEERDGLAAGLRGLVRGLAAEGFLSSPARRRSQGSPGGTPTPRPPGSRTGTRSRPGTADHRVLRGPHQHPAHAQLPGVRPGRGHLRRGDLVARRVLQRGQRDAVLHLLQGRVERVRGDLRRWSARAPRRCRRSAAGGRPRWPSAAPAGRTAGRTPGCRRAARTGSPPRSSRSGRRRSGVERGQRGRHRAGRWAARRTRPPAGPPRPPPAISGLRVVAQPLHRRPGQQRRGDQARGWPAGPPRGTRTARGIRTSQV